MIDLFNLTGLSLCFVGSLLLVFFRAPAIELTADGRSLSSGPEPTAPERSANLRRYWRSAAITKVGLAFLCVGFGLQLLAFVASLAGASDETEVSHKIVSRAMVHPR